MQDQTIKKVAAFAPTTKEDLAASGLLGEQIMEEYGARLTKVVRQFVEKNGLEDYIANRPNKRSRADDSSNAPKVPAVVVQSSSTVRAGNAKARKAVIEIDSDDDEFGTEDFDYSKVYVP